MVWQGLESLGCIVTTVGAGEEVVQSYSQGSSVSKLVSLKVTAAAMEKGLEVLDAAIFGHQNTTQGRSKILLATLEQSFRGPTKPFSLRGSAWSLCRQLTVWSGTCWL